VFCAQAHPDGKLSLTKRHQNPGYTHAMKFLLAFAAGWIAFYLADQALYDGQHVALVARFVGSIASGFTSR
jgi:dolichyl-phosphate-mannose--protein O-mannosyl transferase